jgi:hypothetical protein
VNNEKICKCFKQGSRNIWNQYGDFFELNFSVGEETITETTLIDLVKKLPNTMLSKKFEAAINPFNKADERENGADFEWYIIDGDEWIKFLVQAKKLKFAEQAKGIKMYYELKREYEDKTTQCQNLIYNAWKHDFIPLYCFYNFFDVIENGKFIPQSNNEDFPVDYELMGWTYTYADIVYKDERNKKFEDIYSDTKTVASLFCSDKSIHEILEDYNGDDDGNGGNTVNIPPDGSGGGGGILPKPKIKPKNMFDLPDYVKKILGESGIDIGNYGEIQDDDAKPQSSKIVAVTVRIPVNGKNQTAKDEKNANGTANKTGNKKKTHIKNTEVKTKVPATVG